MEIISNFEALKTLSFFDINANVLLFFMDNKNLILSKNKPC